MPALIKRTEGTAEWSLVWPPFDGGDDLQKGYVATTDPERAKWWARFYELGQGTEDTFNRDDYVAAQKFARLDHAAWLKGQPAGVGGSTDLAPVLTAVAGVSEQVAAVPSAEQNGAAARSAIIK